MQTGSTLDPSELGRPPGAGLGLQRHSSETLHAAPPPLSLQAPGEQARRAAVMPRCPSASRIAPRVAWQQLALCFRRGAMRWTESGHLVLFMRAPREQAACDVRAGQGGGELTHPGDSACHAELC